MLKTIIANAVRFVRQIAEVVVGRPRLILRAVAVKPFLAAVAFAAFALSPPAFGLEESNTGPFFGGGV